MLYVLFIIACEASQNQQIVQNGNNWTDVRREYFHKWYRRLFSICPLFVYVFLFIHGELRCVFINLSINVMKEIKRLQKVLVKKTTTTIYWIIFSFREFAIEFYSPVHCSPATNWNSIHFAPWNFLRMYQQYPVLKEILNWKSFSCILYVFNLKRIAINCNLDSSFKEEEKNTHNWNFYGKV